MAAIYSAYFYFLNLFFFGCLIRYWMKRKEEAYNPDRGRYNIKRGSYIEEQEELLIELSLKEQRDYHQNKVDSITRQMIEEAERVEKKRMEERKRIHAAKIERIKKEKVIRRLSDRKKATTSKSGEIELEI